MFCTNCGKELEVKAKYCPECGYQLVAEEEEKDLNENNPAIIRCDYSNFSGATKKKNGSKNNKKKKKGLLYAIIIIGVLMLLSSLGTSETDEDSDRTVMQDNENNDFSYEPTAVLTSTPVPEESKLVKLSFEIECESNLLFNTYDLKVMFNDTQIGKLEHGETDSFSAEVEAGIYTLELCSVDSNSVNGTVKVNADKDSTFKYVVSCHGGEVEITAVEKIKAPVIVSELGTQEYSDVKQAFLDAGFTNVKVNEIKDLAISERNKNKVVSNITIDNISDYTKEDTFFEDVPVVITYRTPQKINMVKNSSDYEGMYFQDVKKELEDLGFINIEVSFKETTDVSYSNGEVYDVNVLSLFGFSAGEGYEYDTTIRIKYYTVNEPTSAPTKTPIPTKAPNITVDNNMEFASLMQILDITDVETIGAFAHSHQGDIIEFDGSVIVMAHHENYNTRFDVWIVGGDYDPDRVITGPLFMFENVNYYDMNVIGIDSVEEMKNFHIVAQITGFNEDSCWISLEPISMTYREVNIASEYEEAFVRKLNGYSIYYMFDTDKQAVIYFVTNDTYVDRGTYSGEFSSGITIQWNHGEYTEKFIHTGGSKAMLIDGNDFEWDYIPCDVSEAESALNKIR